MRQNGYRHRLRVMLGHDEIRVEEHIRRYTRSQVAKMWKSYRATGMSAMDEKPEQKQGMNHNPTFEELGLK